MLHLFIAKTKSTLDLSQHGADHMSPDLNSDLCRSQSVSQCNLGRFNSLQPIDADTPLEYGQMPEELEKHVRHLVIRRLLTNG